MFTSLDLLIVVFMGLVAAALLSLLLMFLLKNKIAKKVCFYVVAALGLYVSTIGLRIGLGGWFPEQIGIGIIAALASVGAFVLELCSKGDEKKLRIARIAVAVALVLGMANAFFI